MGGGGESGWMPSTCLETYPQSCSLSLSGWKYWLASTLPNQINFLQDMPKVTPEKMEVGGRGVSGNGDWERGREKSWMWSRRERSRDWWSGPERDGEFMKGREYVSDTNGPVLHLKTMLTKTHCQECDTFLVWSWIWSSGFLQFFSSGINPCFKCWHKMLQSTS